jgi:hypothetical protein
MVKNWSTACLKNAEYKTIIKENMHKGGNGKVVAVFGKIFEDGLKSEKRKILYDFWRMIMGLVEVTDLRDSFNYLNDEKEVTTEQMLVQIRTLYVKAAVTGVKDGFEDLIWRSMQMDNDIGLKAKLVYEGLEIKTREIVVLPPRSTVGVDTGQNSFSSNSGGARGRVSRKIKGAKVGGKGKGRKKGHGNYDSTNPVIEEAENEDESLETSAVKNNADIGKLMKDGKVVLPTVNEGYPRKKVEKVRGMPEAIGAMSGLPSFNMGQPAFNQNIATKLGGGRRLSGRGGSKKKFEAPYDGVIVNRENVRKDSLDGSIEKKPQVVKQVTINPVANPKMSQHSGGGIQPVSNPSMSQQNANPS